MIGRIIKHLRWRIDQFVNHTLVDLKYGIQTRKGERQYLDDIDFTRRLSGNLSPILSTVSPQITATMSLSMQVQGKGERLFLQQNSILNR
jgi:hypothetical protein